MMNIENTLPRFVRLSYMVGSKGDRVTKSVEFAPKVNELSAEDYKGLKDTKAFKGYIGRGDFKEVKAPKKAPEKGTDS